ncbi:DNA primase [Leuconostoc carnosum]|uniref:bifunctional DNA primase/polymerase n=1 Tax=Leuconostoc carnosum TaxID=1252 RepID=UPI00123B0B53|nr:bifunctional DNA primase/polymerase [Leuconostoc carnosum]KAA8373142.1 DNA primase [Leuconostoc carnosum]
MSETQKKPLNTNLQANVQETNNFIKSDCIIKSHDLIEQGFKVYLLAQGTNSPYAGSNGHLDATNSVKALTNMFIEYGAESNVAISLKGTNLVVLDIDRHTRAKNGLRSLKQAGINANFDSEVFETTPRQGIHVFYRVPDDLDVKTFKHDLMDGVELITDKITVAPSIKSLDGGSIGYQHFGSNFTDANSMPQWLIDLATNVPTNGHGKHYRQAKFTVDQYWQMVLDGFSEGQRNNQVASLTGYLFKINVDVNTAYQIVNKINESSNLPLVDKEINNVFRSIYNAEKRRRLRMKGGSE